MKTKVKRLFIFPSYICNQRCSYCFLNSKKSLLQYPFNDIKSIIDSSGYFNLASIGGGEPFLYKNLIELVHYCKKTKNADVQIFTNGTINNYNKISALKDAGLDSIITTFHSDENITHDAITNFKGSFIRLLDSINIFKKINLHFVTAQIIVHKFNYKKLKSIVEFCSTLGIKKFSIQNLIFNGNINFPISLIKIKPYLNECLNFLNKNNLEWYTNSLPLCIINKKHWSNCLNFTENTEFTNLKIDKVLSKGYTKSYGLTISKLCQSKCNISSLCPGTWKSYWNYYLKGGVKMSESKVSSIQNESPKDIIEQILSESVEDVNCGDYTDISPPSN